jgi:hypothetical protein
VETIKLKHPIEWNGQPIAELRFNRPKLRDLLKANRNKKAYGDAADDELTLLYCLLSQMVQIPLDALEDLDLEDAMVVMEKLKPFLSPAGTT